MADGPVVHRVADARLPTERGPFRCLAFRSDADVDGVTHLALVCGTVAAADDPVLVRVHSECLTGDVFGSRRCDCGPQLDAAMRLIAGEGRGVVVYLCGHEGRGIGIADKLRAYELQDAGRDTVDANLELGLPVDDRDYAAGAAILHDLGVDRIRLLTNNPAKTAALTAHGIEVVAREPLVTPVHEDNAAYLRSKQERLGHRYEPDA
jgi:3,4-dihydroxy 2-butanone 4-phosphate synthase / GTP cyclohydrolase II